MIGDEETVLKMIKSQPIREQNRIESNFRAIARIRFPGVLNIRDKESLSLISRRDGNGVAGRKNLHLIVGCGPYQNDVGLKRSEGWNHRNSLWGQPDVA